MNQKIIRILTNALIVSYLVVIYFTGVPETNTFNERLKKNLQPISFALGIWPSWSMFAPNPIKFDSKTFAIITYSDGTQLKHDVEDKTSGILKPFRNARWMKYSQDNLRNPRLQALRPLAAQHFKSRFDTPARTVTKVELLREWRDIVPFKESGKLPPLNSPYTDKQFSETLYTHNFGAN